MDNGLKMVQQAVRIGYLPEPHKELFFIGVGAVFNEAFQQKALFFRQLQ